MATWGIRKDIRLGRGKGIVWVEAANGGSLARRAGPGCSTGLWQSFRARHDSARVFIAASYVSKYHEDGLTSWSGFFYCIVFYFSSCPRLGHQSFEPLAELFWSIPGKEWKDRAEAGCWSETDQALDISRTENPSPSTGDSRYWFEYP